VFSFRNIDDSDYNYLAASGFNKSGSDNLHVLLGGGDHRDINDFITNDSWNNITGKKWFKTDNGNDWDSNTLRIQGTNGYDAGLTFYRDGIDASQIIFDGYYFNFKTADNLGYKAIRAAGFIKNGFDDNYLLLAGGQAKAISDFALASQLGNYVPISGDLNVWGIKTFTGEYYNNG
jgi:hypothetical protein